VITVHMQDGLGNQLYQYAFGRTLMKLGFKVQFNIDWFVRKWGTPPRNLSLTKFIEMPTISGENESVATCLSEREILSVSDIRDNIHLFGHWQKRQWYLPILTEIQQEIRLFDCYKDDEFSSSLDKAQRSVGVHIRRGDYVTKKHRSPLPLDYFHQAISKTEGDLFVFSDDAAWCYENIQTGTRNAVFESNLPDYQAFELLRACPTKVISNSTFSFWAALLGGGNVLCPSFDKKDEIPAGWMVC
jgi:hypothetical protein